MEAKENFPILFFMLFYQAIVQSVDVLCDISVKTVNYDFKNQKKFKNVENKGYDWYNYKQYLPMKPIKQNKMNINSNKTNQL